ncbi:MAG TPA: glycosyltransferase family 4 protein [Tepidisphaeraceae bacterium]|nr:glycosyltransferase family 4 protein [Tepidisphaeraceae bacterium]
MMRVLHLIDSQADFQTRRCAEQLSRSLLGPDVLIETRVIPPVAVPWRFLSAWRNLRYGGDFDLVHAWGPAALAAAVLGTRQRLLYTPPVDIGPRAAHWLTAILPYRDLQVICPSGSLHRALVSHGVPLERCHLIRPGVDFARIRRRKDPAFRAALGLADTDYVLLAAGESTRAASHEDAIWAAGILQKLDPRYKLLLWGRGSRLPALEQFHRTVGDIPFVHIAEQRLGRSVDFEELLPAADLIINSATGSVSLLPLQIVMAGALPIVSTVTYTASELLEDHHTALMAPKHSPRLLAQRILELREDPTLQWQMADTARAEAYEFFPLTHFLEEYRQLYRQLATGNPPPPAATPSLPHTA